MNKTEEKIIQQINSKYDYWRKYVKAYDEKIKDIHNNKKAIVEKLKENPFSEEVLEDFEYLSYGNSLMQQDMLNAVTDFLPLYKLAKNIGIEDELEDDVKGKIETILSNEKKPMFVATDQGIEERVKGSKEKYLKMLKESPELQKIKETLIKNLE